MTIKIIDAPNGGSCRWYVDSNVKAVTKFDIIYHDGTSNRKRLCSKVDILSIMDAPEDYEESKTFYRNLLNIPESDYLKSCFDGYLPRMTDAKFEAIDLPTHL